MNRIPQLILCAAALLAAAPAATHAQGTQVYTWTDENGVVHFVDTPPQNPDAVSMQAPEAYRPGTADAYPQAQPTEGMAMPESADGDGANPPEGTADEASYADQQREKLARAREERRRAADEKGRRCADARRQLETLEPSRRVYFTNAQGETERMDDEQRVRLVEEARAVIATDCE